MSSVYREGRQGGGGDNCLWGGLPNDVEDGLRGWTRLATSVRQVTPWGPGTLGQGTRWMVEAKGEWARGGGGEWVAEGAEYSG